MNQLLVPILSISWILCGGWYLLLSLKEACRVKKAKNWSLAKGIIDDSSLFSFISGEGNTLFEVKVRYTYNDGTSMRQGHKFILVMMQQISRSTI